MSVKSYFFNAVEENGTYDRIYNAEDVTSYLDKLVSNGVFASPSNNLQVRTGGDMNIIIGKGQGWIDGHKIVNTADMPLTLDSADVMFNRIDRVVIYYDLDERGMGIIVRKGTNATNPSPVNLVRNTRRWELCLAEVTIRAGVSGIANADIKDTRGDTNVCGFVTGLVEQLDTSTLWQQYYDAFYTWFNDIKTEYQKVLPIHRYNATYTPPAGSVKSLVNVSSLIPEYNYNTDVLQVDINGLLLADSEITNNSGTVSLNTAITQDNAKSNVIGFTVYKSV